MNLPKLPKNYVAVKKRLQELEWAIQEGIDTVCERHNYEVTYAEINSVLTTILNRNLQRDINSLMKGDEDENWYS